MASVGSYRTKKYGMMYRVRYRIDGRQTCRRGFVNYDTARLFADAMEVKERRFQNHVQGLKEALESEPMGAATDGVTKGTEGPQHSTDQQ